MLIYDIIPPEKLKKIVKEEILGIKVYSKKSKKFFALSCRIVLLFFIVLYFGSGITPLQLLKQTIRAISGEEKTINFYANLCSGEWQNLQNTQGKPEVPASGDFSSFSEMNSAVYEGGPSSIICQNFAEIPTQQEQNIAEEQVTTTTENTVNTEIETNQITTTTNNTLTTTTDSVIIESTSTETTDEVTTTTVISELIPFFKKINNSFLSFNALAQENSTLLKSAKIKFSFTIGETEAATTSQQLTTTTQIETSTTSEESISFWKKIKNFFQFFNVKAQETPFDSESTTTSIVSTTTESTFKIPITTTTDETIIDTTTTITNVSEMATTTEATTTTIPAFPEMVATATDFISEETTTNSVAKISIWYSLDGELWTQLDEIKTFTSNALNGGYFEYDAPFLRSWDDVKKLKIKFSGLVSNEANVVAYLDSIWVEMNYQEQEIREKEQGKIEFLSNKKDFRINEEPEFKFKYKKRNPNLLSLVGENLNLSDYWQNINLTTKLLNSKGEIVEIFPDFEVENDGHFLIKFKKPREFKPGVYKLFLRIEERGVVQEFEQTFTRGVLAINTNKSIYLSAEALAKEGLPPETAYLQMAVLDDEGLMVCDADLTLEIVSPLGEKTILKTADGTILVNPECFVHAVTEKPDYEARYTINGVGLYQMNLSAITKNGFYSITDNFEVRNSVPFDIERQGPTRILPTSPYTMKFIIKVNQDFNGIIEETVSKSFGILKTELFLINTGIQPATSSLQSDEESKIEVSIEPFQIITQEDEKIINWTVNWQKNQIYELSYQFDAPDISPYLYLLGPLEFYE